MYHFFFIHSSINGHLGSFHVLAILNSAEMPPYLFVVIYICSPSGSLLSSKCIRSHTTVSASYPSLSEGRQTENHSHRKLGNLITWTTALSNSMKLWVMPCRATQEGWEMVGCSDKTWPTGKGNVKPLQYSCLENPMKIMKRQKDRKLKDELPRPVGAQYATGEDWRNGSRKNEETEPKGK